MNWFKKPASKTWYNIFLTIVKNLKGGMIIKNFGIIFLSSGSLLLLVCLKPIFHPMEIGKENKRPRWE